MGAEPGRAKRESRITCMRMLRTNQSKITRSQPFYAARVNVSCNAFFSSPSFGALNKKTISLTLILWQKTNRNVVYRGLFCYRQQVRVITLFPNIFSYCFCMLSDEFAKVFERKVWRVQVAHLHNAARALQVRVGVFNCQQILTKISIVVLDVVVKKEKKNKKNKSNVV